MTIYKYKSKEYFKFCVAITFGAVALFITKDVIVDLTESLKADKIAKCQTQFPKAFDTKRIGGVLYCQTHENVLQKFRELR